MAISPQNNEKTVFYTGKLYGLTGMDKSDEKLMILARPTIICFFNKVNLETKPNPVTNFTLF